MRYAAAALVIFFATPAAAQSERERLNTPAATRTMDRAAMGERWPFTSESVVLECYTFGAAAARLPSGERIGLNPIGRGRFIDPAQWRVLAPGFTVRDLRGLAGLTLSLC